MRTMRPETGADRATPGEDVDDIKQAAHALGLRPTDDQVGRWLAHLALIAKWNRVYNLTAVRDPIEMRRQHLVDCLAMMPSLQRHLTETSPAEGHPRILDVGSGAGLPGVVIAVGLPDAQITCVDTVDKKATFIRQVAAELRLPNLRSEHARIENLAPQHAHVITSRAFASLVDFVALTRRHLADNGVWLAMKGKHPSDEMAALPSNVEVFHVEPLTVPGLPADRCLVWMRARVA